MGLFKSFAGSLGWNAGRSTVEAFKTIAANFALLEPSVRTSAAANYVPVLGDRVIRRTAAGAQTLTIPTNAAVAFPIGTQITVQQAGAGLLTLAAAGGVTIEKLAAKGLNSLGQGAVVRLIKMDTNAWSASGDLAAA